VVRQVLLVVEVRVGLPVAPGQDDELILACAVCIDHMGRG
jgi:hypothetical protein